MLTIYLVSHTIVAVTFTVTCWLLNRSTRRIIDRTADSLIRHGYLAPDWRKHL